MPNLQWSEIRTRAAGFVKKWKEIAPKAREEADAHEFQIDFFQIFNVSTRQVGYFEHRVEKKHGRRGYIDFFWKGFIMTEMKTPGKDMNAAFVQAKEYAESLPTPDQLPKGILISDFLTFDYYDMDKGAVAHAVAKQSFKLEELPEKVELFGYLADYKENEYHTISEVDIKAAEMMGELHDALKENKYTGHDLEMYLVRLLFCLFADDTGIFREKGAFHNYIKNNTNDSGSDLAIHIGLIFDILNTEEKDRQENHKEQFKLFPYIDGGLFEERLRTAAFNSKMRKTLLDCSMLDWSKIKPEIFGAMFQSVKDKEKRRALGEHYTSETNILKVIRPLFLDDLWDEFEKVRKIKSAGREHKLLEFHTKLQRLKFLDPACGCGNFLIVTYRELRMLEIEVIAEYMQTQAALDIEFLVRVNVDQFYGIEIEEFPARIAQTAMWLIDHLMNNKASERFAKYIARIPLSASPSIIIANAIPLDWDTLVPKSELSYILGNPPFVGYGKGMYDFQKKDVENIFEKMKNYGYLDYVTCWYKKAAEYIQGTNIECAFVSTNSICQGEQVGYLWPLLCNKYKIKINFAHKTFKWNNEAKGKAAVYCVIVSFSLFDRKEKRLFVYEDVKGNPKEVSVKRINAYLVDADDVFIESRKKPICDALPMITGNRPLDDGNFLFTEDEKQEFVKKEPLSKKYFKPFISAKEFINGINRYCLWLVDANPSDIKKMPLVLERVENVKIFRLKSPDAGARKLADYPTLFRETNNPESYILIPCTSSENRKYVPMGFFDKKSIPSNSCVIIPEAKIFEFGILTSSMHMAWMRYVCGRLKSDYRYSKDIVYNNFIWPNPTDKQKKEIEKIGQEVLDARAKYPDSTLADLYDPLSMPPELAKAHQKLDKAVEAAYGITFNSDEERVAHLFELYQNKTKDMFRDIKKKEKRKRKK